MQETDAIGLARQRAFADVVCERRIELQLTIEQLAERAGLSADDIRAIEGGERSTVPRRGDDPDPFSTLTHALEWDFITFRERIATRAEQLHPGAGAGYASPHPPTP